jgi:hypothetical protein
MATLVSPESPLFKKYLNLMSNNKTSFVLSYDLNFEFKISRQKPFILKWIWSPQVIVSQKEFLKLFCSEVKYLPNVLPLPCVPLKFYKSFYMQFGCLK